MLHTEHVLPVHSLPQFSQIRFSLSEYSFIICEIYESEIVFYAFTNNLPFQTEPCPHMNEGIRTEIREFLNSLEDQHSGIKNNMYRSIIKISDIMKDSSFKEKRICANCGNECSGKICAVCNMITDLKK